MQIDYSKPLSLGVKDINGLLWWSFFPGGFRFVQSLFLIQLKRLCGEPMVIYSFPLSHTHVIKFYEPNIKAVWLAGLQGLIVTMICLLELSKWSQS